MAIYCDSLSVHKSKETKPWWEKLDIKRIFNVGYSPEFNPIESCFSQVKREFCKERLNALVNQEEFETVKVIQQSFKLVTPQLVTSCVRKSMDLLKTT